MNHVATNSARHSFKAMRNALAVSETTDFESTGGSSWALCPHVFICATLVLKINVTKNHSFAQMLFLELEIALAFCELESKSFLECENAEAGKCD